MVAMDSLTTTLQLALSNRQQFITIGIYKSKQIWTRKLSLLIVNTLQWHHDEKLSINYSQSDTYLYCTWSSHRRQWSKHTNTFVGSLHMMMHIFILFRIDILCYIHIPHTHMKWVHLWPCLRSLIHVL